MIEKILLISCFFNLFLFTLVSNAQEKQEKATFAGGCFWCMEHPFEQLDGVIEVISGYTGGDKENPTYEDVSSGKTGHMEAVQITYDPHRVTYDTLLEVFWRQIDPTNQEGQFADKGTQYRTAIFYHNDSQKERAEESKRALANSKRFKKPIVTQILKASKFYPAEDYHQDYYKKNPIRYKFYRYHSGRDEFLEKAWEEKQDSHEKMIKQNYRKMNKKDLRSKLTPLQFNVTQENGTEKPFDNAYWDNKREGIYVDVVSGEPLFISLDKYDSGTGWPSFTQPLEPDNIVEQKDTSHFMVRREVRSVHGDSHLGHVFSDGAEPTGLRYCINSAALRFIPKEDLEKEGYKKYIKFFQKR